jgi:hypothetical protein
MSPSIGGGVCKLGLRCAPEGPGGRAVGCVECVENLRVCSVHVSSWCRAVSSAVRRVLSDRLH